MACAISRLVQHSRMPQQQQRRLSPSSFQVGIFVHVSYTPRECKIRDQRYSYTRAGKKRTTGCRLQILFFSVCAEPLLLRVCSRGAILGQQATSTLCSRDSRVSGQAGARSGSCELGAPWCTPLPWLCDRFPPNMLSAYVLTYVLHV